MAFNRLASFAVLASALAHGLVLAPLVVSTDPVSNQTYDEGAGDSAFKIEQGLSIDMVSIGDAAERIEVAAVVAPPVVQQTPIEPELKSVITATESPIETEKANDEPPPPPEPPKQVATLEVMTEKSAGVAQDGGRATALTAYIGKIHGALQKVRLDRRVAGSGRVVIGFRVDGTGRVNLREIITSSGSAAIDRAAVEMIDKASFPPPPNELGRDEYYKVPLSFSTGAG